MKTDKKNYYVRVRYPCDYDGAAEVRWINVIASSEKEAFRKARKEASEWLTVTIIAIDGKEV